MQKLIKVNLEHGLEARPIALLVQIATEFQSNIYVGLDGKKINAKSIMGMMSLSLKHGDEILITAEGKDEKEAIDKIEQFLNGNE